MSDHDVWIHVVLKHHHQLCTLVVSCPFTLKQLLLLGCLSATRKQYSSCSEQHTCTMLYSLPGVLLFITTGDKRQHSRLPSTDFMFCDKSVLESWPPESVYTVERKIFTLSIYGRWKGCKENRWRQDVHTVVVTVGAHVATAVLSIMTGKRLNEARYLYMITFR